MTKIDIEKKLHVAMCRILLQFGTMSNYLDNINIGALAEIHAEEIEKDLKEIPLDAKKEECKELIRVTIAGFRDFCEHKVARDKKVETIYYMSVNEMFDLIKISNDLSEYHEDSYYWESAMKVIDALKKVLKEDNNNNRTYLSGCLKEMKDKIDNY